MEKNKLYVVRKNLSSNTPDEIEIKSRTDKFYTRVGSTYKDAFETNYVKAFDDKKEAVDYLESLIKSKISQAKSTLDHYQKQLNEFRIANNV